MLECCVFAFHNPIVKQANFICNIKLANLSQVNYALHMTQTLLAKARAIKRPERKKAPPEREAAQLAVAWACGEVSYSQAQAVLGRSKGASVYGVLAIGLRDAIRLGYLARIAPAEPKKAKVAGK